MDKIIDLKDTIQALSKKYPEFPTIMQELGFENIADPKMIATVGRFMTIEKGAAMKKISMDQIRKVFASHGYQIKE